MSARGPVGDFLDAHRCIGEVLCQPYDNRITVAASAASGQSRIAVHGRTQQGQAIGGLMNAHEARRLISHLQEAVSYAEGIAIRQKVASIPDLERQLQEARDAV